MKICPYGIEGLTFMSLSKARNSSAVKIKFAHKNILTFTKTKKIFCTQTNSRITLNFYVIFVCFSLSETQFFTNTAKW